MIFNQARADLLIHLNRKYPIAPARPLEKYTIA
jgi:hypothetical protein